MTELICHVCGRKYTVENLDPDSPAAYECIDCYKAELEPTEIVNATEPVGPIFEERKS